MTNTTTQQKTGTVTINGRTYTHRRRLMDGVDHARRIDVDSEMLFFAVKSDYADTECVFRYTTAKGVEADGWQPIPAATTRPRELKDVVAELAKGGVPWFSHDGKEWFLQTNYMSQNVINVMNEEKCLFSPNPFKEPPESRVIIYPEITEEVKP